MRTTVLVVVFSVLLCTVAVTSFGNQKKNTELHHVEVVKHPEGVWKKKMVWKARWVKEWKEEKVWKAIWKKVWSPVQLQEWVPLIKPHQTWKEKH